MPIPEKEQRHESSNHIHWNSDESARANQCHHGQVMPNGDCERSCGARSAVPTLLESGYAEAFCCRKLVPGIEGPTLTR